MNYVAEKLLAYKYPISAMNYVEESNTILKGKCPIHD